MSTKMTEKEREAFLAGLHVGVLSLEQPGRGPLTVPVWYAYQPGGELQIITEKTSRKGKLIAEGRRMSVCVQDEKSPYKYVSVEGPIVRIERADVERHERPLAQRYLGRAGGDRYIAMSAASRVDEAMILVHMQPERWLTADYTKEDIGLG